MRGLLAVTLVSMLALAGAGRAHAQDARQRQAAAEAYDRGTAAYLDGGYGEAAQWFETANRMAPAAPALMQAIRSHQRADNLPRAATLALRLQEQYGDQAAAAEYAKTVLTELAPKFARFDVSCDADCKLDLDGKLQEFTSFYLESSTQHALTATFETGSQVQQIQGEAGVTTPLQFVAPPPPPVVDTQIEKPTISTDTTEAHKPLKPIFTFIGAGVTVVLLAGTILSALDMYSHADDYKKAAATERACVMSNGPNCTDLFNKANKLVNDAHGQTRTNVLIGVTAGAAVATGVIAIFLTDWSGKKKAETAGAELRVGPTQGGAFAAIEGRF